MIVAITPWSALGWLVFGCFALFVVLCLFVLIFGCLLDTKPRRRTIKQVQEQRLASDDPSTEALLRAFAARIVDRWCLETARDCPKHRRSVQEVVAWEFDQFMDEQAKTSAEAVAGRPATAGHQRQEIRGSGFQWQCLEEDA